MIFGVIERIARMFGEGPLHKPDGAQSTTATIELLLGRIDPKFRPVLGGLLHFVWAAAMIGFLFLSGRGSQASNVDWLSLLLASTWTGLGPFLIWRYDMVVLPRLFEKARDELADSADVERLHEMVFGKARRRFGEMLLETFFILTFGYVAWTLEPVTAKFGLSANNTALWVIFVVGVMLTAHLAYAGLRSAFISVFTIRDIATLNVNLRVYHSDGLLGLSFLEKYSSSTISMLASGYLLIPALAIGGNHLTIGDKRVVLLLVYTIFALLIFVFSHLIIQGEINEEKVRILRIYGPKLNAGEQQFRSGSFATWNDEFSAMREVYQDVVAISRWPFRLNNIASVFFQLILLPIAAALAANFLQSGQSSPFGQSKSVQGAVETPKSR